MLYPGTDPESHITEYSLVYEEKMRSLACSWFLSRKRRPITTHALALQGAVFEARGAESSTFGIQPTFRGEVDVQAVDFSHADC